MALESHTGGGGAAEVTGVLTSSRAAWQRGNMEAPEELGWSQGWWGAGDLKRG